MFFKVCGVEIGFKSRSKNSLKITLQRQCVLASSCERFGWLSERPRAARSRPKAAKTGPRSAQKWPRATQEGPKSSQKRPKSSQKRIGKTFKEMVDVRSCRQLRLRA